MSVSHSPPTAQPCRSMEEFYSTLNSTLHWPQTEYEETAHIQCPCDAFPELTKDAFASRTCGAGGQWMDANVAACKFDNRDSYCKVYNSVVPQLMHVCGEPMVEVHALR